MTKLFDCAYRIVWGVPMLVLILGVGLYLSLRTRFVQLRLFPQAVQTFFGSLSDSPQKGVSPFRALCTALAATVGTGNLVGVAGALCIGGPGAVFWMWVSAFLGMAAKYAEAVLAVRYRGGSSENPVSGPMYMISQGLHCPPLARLYAVLGLLACFGVGNGVQVNAVISGVRILFPKLKAFWIGILLAILVGLCLLGGAKGIGRIAQSLVPVGTGAYIALCLLLLFLRSSRILPALRAIFLGALCPRAVTGGLLGSAFVTLRTGCSRGIFTNEAGMGTAAIAHGCADVSHPVQQGLMGIMEVFLDTMVVCTLTALSILCSGVPIPYGTDSGGALTEAAFSAAFGPWASGLIACFLCCFAFATILGWSLYGISCFRFLAGTSGEKGFCAAQTAAVLLFALLNTRTVWLIAELLNGLMAVPNLIALTLLSPELVRLTNEYISGVKSADGGTYANIHQCQSL